MLYVYKCFISSNKVTIYIIYFLNTIYMHREQFYLLSY